MKKNKVECPVQLTLEVIGGKWKPVILFHLSEKTMRFNQILRTIPGITQKMLTLQLRELEHHGLVKRKVYLEIPPKVEYSTTAYGKTLHPILDSMSAWGNKHKKRVQKR